MQTCTWFHCNTAHVGTKATSHQIVSVAFTWEPSIALLSTSAYAHLERGHLWYAPTWICQPSNCGHILVMCISSIPCALRDIGTDLILKWTIIAQKCSLLVQSTEISCRLQQAFLVNHKELATDIQQVLSDPSSMDSGYRLVCDDMWHDLAVTVKLHASLSDRLQTRLLQKWNTNSVRPKNLQA